MIPKNQLYQEKWELSEVEPLCKTPRGHLFRCTYKGTAAVLKIFTGAGIEEERRGVDFLKTCRGFGVVDVFVSDANAVLLEYCSGPTLENLVQSGNDDQATEIILKLAETLHSCAIPPVHSFQTLQVRFRSLFDTNPTQAPFCEKAKELANFLCAHQENIALLHGDIHHGNIIQHKEKGWLLIDPKGCIGDPAYDLANLFLNPWEMPEIVRNKNRVLRQAEICAERTGFELQKIINYIWVAACLSQVWFLEEGESSEHALSIIKIVEPLVKF